MKSQVLRGKSVLIVEDEYLLADELAGALQRAGATIVGPAASQSDALALLESTFVDFGILDIQLRDGISYAVADDLAARRIPYLFATGFNKEAVRSKYQDVPIWEKPFAEDRLATALAELRGQ